MRAVQMLSLQLQLGAGTQDKTYQIQTTPIPRPRRLIQPSNPTGPFG
jgi:hypothetical protein